MAAIGWNNVNYSPVGVNPSGALSVASNAAKGLVDSYAEEQKARSLADYQQQTLGLANRRQDFVEGEPDRAILAEQQKFERDRKRAGDQSKAISGIISDIEQKHRENFSFSDQTVQELQNNKLFQQMPELAQKQYMATQLGQVKDNPNSFIDKKLFGSEVRQAITDAGHGKEAANSAITGYNDTNFATGNLKSAELQINALGKPISDAAQLKLFSGGNGNSRGGSNGYFDVGNAIKSDEFLKNFYSTADDKSFIANAVGADTNLLDWGSNEVYKDSVKSIVSNLAKYNINEVSTVKALQSIAIKNGTFTDEFKALNTNEALSEPAFDKLLATAQDFQNLGQRGGSQRRSQAGILSGMAAMQTNRANNISSILSTLTNTGPGQKGRSSALSNNDQIRSFAKKYGYDLPVAEAPKKDKPIITPKPKPQPDIDQVSSKAENNSTDKPLISLNSDDKSIDKLLKSAKSTLNENSKGIIEKNAASRLRKELTKDKPLLSKKSYSSNDALLNNPHLPRKLYNSMTSKDRSDYDRLLSLIDTDESYFNSGKNLLSGSDRMKVKKDLAILQLKYKVPKK